MTVCSECGGPLDPDVTHVKHFGCSADDWDDCDCPEVCAGCCTDPGCALRPDQETPMTFPAREIPDDLYPTNWEGKPQRDTLLVDDLAAVLASTVVGWEKVIGHNLAEAPEVKRVMARYRAETQP